MRILLLRPERDDPSPVDQFLGARLAARRWAAGQDSILIEELFQDDAGLETKLTSWRDQISAVIGATNVPESTRLGELAANMNLLCFVANNNPVVWHGRPEVFHIGWPTSQTTAAVSALIAKANRRRVLLLHDCTEFQSRVAANMERALESRGIETKSLETSLDESIQCPHGWEPDLIYVIFSSEPKALAVARLVGNMGLEAPMLFGRSLLRETFLGSLETHEGESWFVDLFHRDGEQPVAQREFFHAMAAKGIHIPTANHAFGWDCMMHCAAALKSADGNPSRAIDYLESGVMLEGASGRCCFSRGNHNGRFHPGPHTITRWRNRQLESL
jgi:ABC-type branched-subunit amino acid transport system substrate-binding protein